MGLKLASFYPANEGTAVPTHMAMVLLFRPETEEPLAVMDGRLITGPAPVLCLPADPNKMGTKLERPNPTRINPTIATSGVRIRRARATPAAARSSLPWFPH